MDALPNAPQQRTSVQAYATGAQRPPVPCQTIRLKQDLNSNLRRNYLALENRLGSRSAMVQRHENQHAKNCAFGDFLPYVVLICGLLFIAFLADTAFWQRGYDQGVRAAATDTISRRLHEIEETCKVSSDPDTAAACFKRSIFGALEEWPKSQDFAAQVSMATSGRWSVYLSAASLLIAAVTIYWVHETLAASRGATKAAQDMVMLERPWILPAEQAFQVRTSMIPGNHGRPVLTYFMDLKWFISGKIPARITYMTSKIADAEEGLPDFEALPKNKLLHEAIAAPGSEITTGPFELDVQEVDNIIRTGRRVFIWAKIQYSTHDVLLKDGFTEVVYQVIPRRQHNPQQPVFFEWVPQVTRIS